MSSTKKSSALAELSAQLSGAVEAAAKFVVAIHARRRIPSSGIVWRDGVIVSANHTVRRDGEISITLPTGESATATVAGRDAGRDLVALRVNGASTPAAPMADADAARIGSPVLAVGRPGRNVSASFGIISAVGEGWRTAHGARIDRVLRLDLAIYDGFSGSPLVDASGAVVGVNTSTLAGGAPVALPAATVDRVLDELLARGHVRRPYIGVAVHPVALGPGVVSRHNLARELALVVLSVADGSPADMAGVLVGDVLTGAGGQPLTRPADLLDAISSVPSGGSLELTVLRGGTAQTTTVTPVDRGGGGQDE